MKEKITIAEKLWKELELPENGYQQLSNAVSKFQFEPAMRSEYHDIDELTLQITWKIWNELDQETRKSPLVYMLIYEAKNGLQLSDSKQYVDIAAKIKNQVAGFEQICKNLKPNSARLVHIKKLWINLPDGVKQSPHLPNSLLKALKFIERLPSSEIIDDAFYKLIAGKIMKNDWVEIDKVIYFGKNCNETFHDWLQSELRVRSYTADGIKYLRKAYIYLQLGDFEKYNIAHTLALQYQTSPSYPALTIENNYVNLYTATKYLKGYKIALSEGNVLSLQQEKKYTERALEIIKGHLNAAYEKINTTAGLQDWLKLAGKFDTKLEEKKKAQPRSKKLEYISEIGEIGKKEQSPWGDLSPAEQIHVVQQAILIDSLGIKDNLIQGVSGEEIMKKAREITRYYFTHHSKNIMITEQELWKIH